MPYMELTITRSTTFTACFLLLLLLLLPLPYFSTGASQAVESEIYEIDYRGPETHSSSPPPDRHHPHPHPTPLSNHRKPSLGSATLNNHPKQQQVKGIHG